ncbi:MAG: DUF4785 domain-containing protein [Pseudomonadota bacterium]
MKKTLFLALLGTTCAVTAAEVRYLAPTGKDLTVEALAPLPKRAEPLFNEAREPVAVSWAVEADAVMAFDQTPFRAESRQYYLDTTAGELAAGIEIFTTAPGALIRLSPAAGAKQASLDVADLTIKAGDREYAAAEVIRTFADEAALKATGASFARGTVAFRLLDSVGEGVIGLRVDSLAKAAGARYVVNVHEPESNLVLHATASRDSYRPGTPIAIEVGFQGAELQASDFRGYVSAPDGRSVGDLRFSTGPDGRIFGLLPRAGAASSAPGLWEAHVFADGDGPDGRVLRDARTAFALAQPSGRLTGQTGELAWSDAGLELPVGIEAAAAGRFEVRAVLFGTLADGQLVPVAVAHAATWLEAGTGEVSLSISGATLASAGAGAPYELRHLELRDQSRMRSLWRQERAFRLVP